MIQKKKPKPTPKVDKQPLARMENPKTDPQGSWTGIPENRNDTPVQDADDLYSCSPVSGEPLVCW